MEELQAFIGQSEVLVLAINGLGSRIFTSFGNKFQTLAARSLCV
jgi:hypothetical protein